MQIDTHLGYDVYKIFINFSSLNEVKAQDKIDFFSYWIDKGMFNKKRWQGYLVDWWYIVERRKHKISKGTVYKSIAERERVRERERKRQRQRQREREKKTQRVKEISIPCIRYGCEIFHIAVNRIAIMTFIFAFKSEDYLFIGFGIIY